MFYKSVRRKTINSIVKSSKDRNREFITKYIKMLVSRKKILNLTQKLRITDESPVREYIISLFKCAC